MTPLSGFTSGGVGGYIWAAKPNHRGRFIVGGVYSAFPQQNAVFLKKMKHFTPQRPWFFSPPAKHKPQLVKEVSFCLNRKKETFSLCLGRASPSQNFTHIPTGSCRMGMTLPPAHKGCSTGSAHVLFARRCRGRTSSPPPTRTCRSTRRCGTASATTSAASTGRTALWW